MCESDLEHARKVILSGKMPFAIKRYRPRRVFWVFFCFFAVWLAVLNNLGYLLPAFWEAIIFFLPSFGLLVALRAALVRSASADMAVIFCSVIFYGLAAAYGLASVNSPLTDVLPSNLVLAAKVIP